VSRTRSEPRFDAIGFDQVMISFDHVMIGFDRIMNRALHDRFRPKQVSHLNQAAVNAVVRVTLDGVQVMHSSDHNLPAPIQDTRQFQADLFRSKQVVLG